MLNQAKKGYFYFINIVVFSIRRDAMRDSPTSSSEVTASRRPQWDEKLFSQSILNRQEVLQIPESSFLLLLQIQ